MTEENKEKRKRKLLIILLILLLLLLLIGAIFIIHYFAYPSAPTITTDLPTSLSQKDILLPKKEYKDEYTEIVGYGLIEVYEEQPNIFLINPEGNTVYFQFDVYEKGTLLYSSKLIEPGKMEEFDVYDLLAAGPHTLTYVLTSYDLTTKELLMAGINQEQEISIRK